MGDEFDAFSRPGLDDHFRHNALFVGPGDRQAVNAGTTDYTPIFLSEIPTLFSSGTLPLDVALLQVCPPDEHGFMSLGVEVLASKAAAESARTVIVQVNTHMPRILGDAFLHISRVHAVVESDEPLPELQGKRFGQTEKQIGEYLADLIPDGATLQLGIGTIPDAVLASLDEKRDLCSGLWRSCAATVWPVLQRWHTRRLCGKRSCSQRLCQIDDGQYQA